MRGVFLVEPNPLSNQLELPHTFPFFSEHLLKNVIAELRLTLAVEHQCHMWKCVVTLNINWEAEPNHYVVLDPNKSLDLDVTWHVLYEAPVGGPESIVIVVEVGSDVVLRSRPVPAFSRERGSLSNLGNCLPLGVAVSGAELSHRVFDKGIN